MLQPLGDYIRLRRQQRNLTQERLAKLAGVSRRQLSLLEDGRNVSVLFLLKIVEALDLTEVPVGSLRVRTAPADLAGLVEAAGLLERLQRSMSGMEEDLSRAVSVVRGAMEQAMGHDLSTRALEEAADTLASLPPERP